MVKVRCCFNLQVIAADTRMIINNPGTLVFDIVFNDYKCILCDIFSSACVYRAELLSWCTSVDRLSFHKLMFLGNRSMDPNQILWEATYPPYLLTIFFSQNFQLSNIYYSFFIFVNMGPYGSKISKLYSSSFHAI